MKCTCFVRGANVTELRENAVKVAEEFADGADYELSWPDDTAHGWLDDMADTDKRFSASVTVSVADPKPASSS